MRMGDVQMTNILTMGNVPLQLVDNKKGSMSNRINCAGETLKNNAINGTKSYAIIGGTALAVDTFAGNKKVAKAVVKTTKSVASNFADKIATKFPKAASVLNSGAKKLDDVFAKLKDTDAAKKIVSKADDVLNSGAMKNVKSKIAGAASKLANSPLVKTLSKNKKLAIIGTGAVALTGVLMKWANEQGRIDQKYEDKAKVAKHYEVL